MMVLKSLHHKAPTDTPPALRKQREQQQKQGPRQKHEMERQYRILTIYSST